MNVSSDVGSLTHISDPKSPLWSMVSVTYPSSKTALNMVTVMYAKELRDTPIKVNAANPGYCATDFNGHSGFRTAREGAEVSAHLATLPPDGPTGVLWGFRWTEGTSGTYGVLPWWPRATPAPPKRAPLCRLEQQQGAPAQAQTHNRAAPAQAKSSAPWSPSRSRVRASVSTSSRLQNAHRTSGRPASLWS